jgi:hypothetical protein
MTRRRETTRSAAGDAETQDGDREQVSLLEPTMLDELPKSIASAEDHPIEMLLRQPQLATDHLLILVVEVEPHQNFPIPGHRHLLEHPPRHGGPLTSPDALPIGIVLGSGKLFQGFSAG